MSNDHHEARSALEQLAQRYGIGVQFEDALGRHISVSAATIQLLLASMGVSVADEAEAKTALEQFDQEAAARSLPASIVVTPRDGGCALEVKLPAGTDQLAWQVVLEDGKEISGVADSFAASPQGKVSLRIPDLPFGYHRLQLPEISAEANLIVSPGRCWLPPKTATGYWGIAVQLYLLRSAANWGIGDFSDLQELIKVAGPRGCAVIGLNPLHQMFLDDPEAASPYSPATRLYLNPLYIDVLAVPEFGQSEAAQTLVESADFQRRLGDCRATKLVDYTAVTALKLEALQLVFESFTKADSAERKNAMAAFRAEKGESLERVALFQVMRQHFASENPSQASWQDWPTDMQIAGSPAQMQFAREHEAELDFQIYLQFLADEQLARAAEEARRQGMAIGLYRDLAVGCDRSGAETWANPPAFLQSTLVGAPPDIFNPAGQNWGLPPFDPIALKREGYKSFAELIRSNMAHAGGLRIDHVMGLARLYCIPEGKSSAEGAYVSFPLDDLIGVLALESQRQQCLVVGEDLGTVPPGFREQLAAANILSYRVLFFEQDFQTGTFVPPDQYPELALTVTGSHDLPTLEAWWEGDDITLKDSLGLYGTEEETRSQQERRDRERLNILEAFTQAGLFSPAPRIADVSPELFAREAHRFLGMTRSTLLVTQLDDMTGDIAPVNVPGTSTEHPNWRRKYAMTIEELAEDPDAWSLVEPLRRAG
ncbi:4-alpha-glucanotransferase [Devosia sp. 1566]|uniref:4-alpha-glucanotransferase n=1 Tax=Devosia sp. 1566 TaxID=2499144 RepID=UPI000FD875D5|nr:4-alpha-glucanotransferase [Devosia sp. 1566]